MDIWPIINLIIIVQTIIALEWSCLTGRKPTGILPRRILKIGFERQIERQTLL